MNDSIFGDYSFFEFVQEFFKTLVDVLAGVLYAFLQVFHDIGPLKVILGVYIFVLALAVVSELKKNQRKREAAHRAYQQELEARRAEERRRKEEREERINQYKQRELKRGVAKMLPPGVAPHTQSKSPSHQRPGQRNH